MVSWPTFTDQQGSPDPLIYARAVRDVAQARYEAEFATLTAMNAVSGDFAGQTAFNAEDSGLYLWDGSAWQPFWIPRHSWTPTVENLSLGTGGTLSGMKEVVAGWCRAHFTFTSGTSAAASGALAVMLPYAVSATVESPAKVGDITISDGTPERLWAATVTLHPDRNKAYLRRPHQNGSYSAATIGAELTMSTTVPGDWAYNATTSPPDTMHVTLFYPLA